MSDEEYAREVDRKRIAGTPLTQPVDIDAYKRGKAGSGSTAPVTSPAPAPVSKPPKYTPPTYEPFTPPSSPRLTWEEALQRARGLISTPGELPWEEALKQSGQQVSPLYNEEIRKALARTQEDLTRRGFFGQLPGLAVTTETQAGMEAQKQGKIAELARMLQQNQESLRQAGRREQSELARQFMGSAEAEAERLSNIAYQNWQARQQAAQQAAQAQYQNELAQYQSQQEMAAQALKAATDKQSDFWKLWQTMANVTGTIPPMYEGDPTATIRYAQELYAQAQARGDRAGMESAHQMAEEARRQAGWETGDVTGAASAYRMTQAGLPTSEITRAMLPYQHPTATSLLPYQMGPTPYEQQRLGMEQQRLAQAAARAVGGGGSARGSSESEIKRQNMADAQQEIWDELNSGKSIYEVEAKIMQNAHKYTIAGINPMDMVDYAWYTWTGAKKPRAEVNMGALSQQEIQGISQSMIP